MAQFDVHRLDRGMVVDCQSDLLSGMDSRFVIPLVFGLHESIATPRLNPTFDVDGRLMHLLTQQAGTVRKQSLGQPVASLAHHSFEITDAIDVLLSGV